MAVQHEEALGLARATSEEGKWYFLALGGPVDDQAKRPARTVLQEQHDCFAKQSCCSCSTVRAGRLAWSSTGPPRARKYHFPSSLVARARPRASSCCTAIRSGRQTNRRTTASRRVSSWATPSV